MVILEEQTKKEFGYYSWEISPKSSRIIVVSCDMCGKIRRSIKHSYSSLCGSCCLKGKHLSEEHKRNISKSEKGKKLSEERKQKIRRANSGERNFNYGKHLSAEIRRKIGDANRGEKNCNYGKKTPIETKKKLREAIMEQAGVIMIMMVFWT